MKSKRFSINPKKRRDTPVSQIVHLVNSDDRLAMSRAMLVAEFGRPLLKAELELLDFYLYFAASKMIQNRKEKNVNPEMLSAEQRQLNAIWEKGVECAVKRFGDDICQIFLKAVKEHDGEKIIEIAKAVWFFKDKLGPNFVHADEERSSLFLLKHQLEQKKLKCTIRKVAEYLAWVKWRKNYKIGDSLKSNFPKVETPADGFSSLRRKCHEINFPLAISRKISRK